jgi:hypothetical protein
MNSIHARMIASALLVVAGASHNQTHGVKRKQSLPPATKSDCPEIVNESPNAVGGLGYFWSL